MDKIAIISNICGNLEAFAAVLEDIKQHEIELIYCLGNILTEKAKWYSSKDINDVWKCREEEKIICDIGSVGQPRNKDFRACYVIFTGQEITYRCVSYDYSVTQKKLHRIRSLDNNFAKCF